jgi:hypothetical protein
MVGCSAVTRVRAESTSRYPPVTRRDTAATRWAIAVARCSPYGCFSVGGRRITRVAMRKAIGGRKERRSSIQAVRIACELPSTRNTRVVVTARNARVPHSSRVASRRARRCSSGSSVRPKRGG